MNLCTYFYDANSLYTSDVLPECPLGVQAQDASACPCRWAVNGSNRCTYPDNYKGQRITDPAAVRESVARVAERMRKRQPAPAPEIATKLVAPQETKTMSAPAPASARPTQLWPNPIPIIGVTGEYASGKTLFGLTIAPGPETLVYDTEKSAESYQGLGFARVDVPAEMLKKHPNGYKPVETFAWWREHVRSQPAGRYRVIVLDTASEIETGAADWVRTNPAYFNRTAGQYLKMSGLFWGDMKELWKALLSDLASRCETFVFTVHMGDVWSGERPTGKRKPKGKSTLMELASLYLQMDRKADVRGNVPAVPSAVVLKSRLAHTHVNAQTGEVEIVPALPPRLSQATPATIRQYQLTPPNFASLKPEELAPEQNYSADDLADIRLATAQAEAEAERLKLEREERQRSATAARQQQSAKQQSPAGATAPAPVAPNNPPAGTAAPPTNGNGKPTPTPITEEQLAAVKRFAAEYLWLRGDHWVAEGRSEEDAQIAARADWVSLLNRYCKSSAKDLTKPQAEDLLARLPAIVKAEEAAEAKRRAEEGQAVPPF